MRFRKSINFGKHFRINLSSKGIGYSYGVKGYRHTVSADGKEKITTSIPKTGISNVEDVKQKKYHRSSNAKPLLIILIAVFACLFVCSQIYDYLTSPKIPPKDTASYIEANAKTSNKYFDFGDTATVFVTETKTEYIKCCITDIAPDEITASIDDANIANVSISEIKDNVLTLEINGISSGSTFFELKSLDGEKISAKLCIIVDELYPSKTTAPIDNGLYIINISNGVFHFPDCDYLPDSENQKTVFSRDDAIANGGTPCKHCNP